MSLPDIVVWEDLRLADIPPRTWHVNGLVTPGLNTIIAKKRQGKSWFSLSLAVAVASGEDFLLMPTVPGKVLYINTELDATASHERAEKYGHLPSGLFVCHGWERGKQALTDLEAAIQKYGLNMIVVDMLTGIIPVGMDTNDYGDSSMFWNELRRIGQRNGVSILGLWHSGKAERADFIDAALGSTALVGQSDSVIGLSKLKSGNRVQLEVTGNHGKDIDLTLVFDDCRWSLASADDEETGSQGLTALQLASFNILNKHPEGITASELAKEHGVLTSEQVRTHLRNLEKKGLVKNKVGTWHPVNPVKPRSDHTDRGHTDPVGQVRPLESDRPNRVPDQEDWVMPEGVSSMDLATGEVIEWQSGYGPKAELEIREPRGDY